MTNKKFQNEPDDWTPKATHYFKIKEKRNLKRIREDAAIKLAIKYNNTNNAKELKWIIDQMVKICAGEYYQDVLFEIGYKWDKGVKPKNGLED